MKAAFVFSFARYIEWPPERLVPPEAPFVIGLTVNSSLLAELEAIVRTRSLQGRRVLVRQVRTGEEARQTHLLFIDPKDEKLLLDELGDLLTSGVVTVGESSRFDEAGG
ncbi:MAG TPA: YfiR family protein, partial [Candidatus Synoicihabitans sp.]|nr:YfiR family protein [Candidatus Synoicihabitans sp.]